MFCQASIKKSFVLLTAIVTVAGALTLAYGNDSTDRWQPEKIHDSKHLHNVLRVSDRLYSGGEPHGQNAFKELAAMGVKTVVSVDGARPDVDAARKCGLRYIHVPIGYDGMEREGILALVRIGRELRDPVYVHCHHGSHRGPAAAAIVFMAGEEKTPQQARRVLEVAGTSKEYPGLWRDVERFVAPPADAKLPELVEVAPVESLAGAMAKIDRYFDNLKLCATEGWRAAKEHPDLVPSQEALGLYEGLRETRRNLSADYDDRFRTWMEEAVSNANQLYGALESRKSSVADQHFQKLRESCKRCHGAYRT